MTDEPTPRPLQLSLTGEHDRGVGPIVGSVIYGDNAELMRQVAPLYLRGSVLDVTYGRGMWWRTVKPDPFASHDIALDGVDFRDLPEGDRSWDTVCFDPPYLPRHGPSDAPMRRDQDFRERFGLDVSRSPTELKALIGDGITEAARVADRWVLAKCCDYSNGRQFRLGHITMYELALRAGLRPHDLIVHASGSGPGSGRIRVVVRARRAHSYLWVFQKPRQR